ncbi:unnamed protein product [Meganyctiphanes norvegica]|uniref:Apple domain-containing protein n=1 Tax=Meganyctiphanes norvegica TaxID=48144 RepID=A0AAV2QJ71_MEGNR
MQPDGAVLLLVALLGPSLASAQCFGGTVTFEKTGGMDFNEPQQPLLQQPGAAITNDCNALCKNTPGCQAFTVDYETSTCLSFDRTSVGRRGSVSSKQSSNLFEKVCLTGVNFGDLCGSERLWSFEKVMDSYLEGHDDKIIPNMDSRTTCMKACLTEGNFTCRSAEYDSVRRQCRLSREDRRTKSESFVYFPGSSVDYIENQCARSLPDCRYETRQDVMVISKDDLQFASSQADCESLCDKTRSFTCRAYTFDGNQNRCYLSGDDSVSLNNTRFPSKNGVSSGEKMCTVSQCERDRGTIIYEKVTGVLLRSARETFYDLSSSARGITENCADRCMDDSTDCPAFSVDYRNSRCYKLDRNTQGRSSDLNPSTGRNYFEKTCVRTALPASCRNKKWQFERVPGKELRGNDDRRLTSVQNRRDCIEACLGETGFLCRSAEYNPTSLVCILSRWDRRTFPDDFVDAASEESEYLENQCTGVDTSCDYQITENAYPRYLDTTIDGIISEIQCQTECTNFDRFNCRSFAYYATASQCFLSGDDKVSAGDTDAIENRAGTNFYDRDCNRDAPVTARPPPTQPETNRPIITTNRPQPTSGGGFRPDFGFGLVSDRCRFGRLTYEKITGYELSGVRSYNLFTAPNTGDRGITKECSDRCANDVNCLAFNLDYNRFECYALTETSADDPSALRQAAGAGYFEGVCLRSGGCGLLWSFDRVPNFKLRDQERETLTGLSKAECMERCLTERRFVCRSANYEYARRICRLSDQDRFSKPTSFEAAPNVDYMENQCASRPEGCTYTNDQQDRYLIYTTKTLSAFSDSACQRAL